MSSSISLPVRVRTLECRPHVSGGRSKKGRGGKGVVVLDVHGLMCSDGWMERWERRMLVGARLVSGEWWV